MKKIILIFLVFILLSFSGAFWFFVNSKPVSTNPKLQDFLIVKGSGAIAIANKLKKEGLIRSPLVFRIYTQASGQANKIVAGEYSLSPSLNMTQILAELTKGPKEVWVTIPEGLRREEVALNFAEALGKDSEFVLEFMALTKGKEGILFPDTYLFAKNTTAQAIVNKMTSTFERKIEIGITGGIEGSDYTQDEILIMASILERETITDSEKAIVAGVLYKRLRAGWPLQADATVQYAIGSRDCRVEVKDCKWWKIPTRADLEVISPYNTYKTTSLPPAPISSPGVTSIQAAAYPEESEYWYYIHDTDGKIRYARTLEEHNANIAKYLQ